MKLDQDWECG